MGESFLPTVLKTKLIQNHEKVSQTDECNILLKNETKL